MYPAGNILSTSRIPARVACPRLKALGYGMARGGLGEGGRNSNRPLLSLHPGVRPGSDPASPPVAFSLKASTQNSLLRVNYILLSHIFEVFQELGDLHPQMDAFDPFHALVRIRLVDVGG